MTDTGVESAAEERRLAETEAPNSGHPSKCNCGSCISTRRALIKHERRIQIDQRETARVEAILQIARWALRERLASTSEAMSTQCVHLMVAVQHDYASEEDPVSLEEEQRTAVVMRGLDLLVDMWHDLPEGERDVVLEGIVIHPELVETWSNLLHRATAIRLLPQLADPETRHRAETLYASVLRQLVRQVVAA